VGGGGLKCLVILLVGWVRLVVFWGACISYPCFLGCLVRFVVFLFFVLLWFGFFFPVFPQFVFGFLGAFRETLAFFFCCLVFFCLFFSIYNFFFFFFFFVLSSPVRCCYRPFFSPDESFCLFLLDCFCFPRRIFLVIFSSSSLLLLLCKLLHQ